MSNPTPTPSQAAKQLKAIKSASRAAFLKVFFGGLAAAIGIWSVVSWQNFERRAQHSKGTIVKVEYETKATGRRGNRVSIARPVVKFPTDKQGHEVTSTAAVNDSHKFTAGQEIEVEYDPVNPAGTVRVDSGFSMVDTSIGVVGLALVANGGLQGLRVRRFKKGGAA